MSTQIRPRTKPADERREDLMNAAEHLFVEQGVASTTIEQITSGAGVAKGSFYLHFTAKEDVVAGLRRRFVDRLREGIKAATDEQAAQDWGGKLAAWALACGRGYAGSVRLHHVVFSDVPPPNQDGLADNILIDHLAQLLADGVAARAWSVADPRFTAIFLFNALHGVILDAAKKGQADALEHRIVGHCFRLVGLPDPEAETGHRAGG